AFDQFNRPADPKRHTDVTATLKSTGANRFRTGMCIASPKTTSYIQAGTCTRQKSFRLSQHFLKLAKKPLQSASSLCGDLKPGLRLTINEDLSRLNVILGFQLVQMGAKITVRDSEIPLQEGEVYGVPSDECREDRETRPG